MVQMNLVWTAPLAGSNERLSWKLMERLFSRAVPLLPPLLSHNPSTAQLLLFYRQTWVSGKRGLGLGTWAQQRGVGAGPDAEAELGGVLVDFADREITKRELLSS